MKDILVARFLASAGAFMFAAVGLAAVRTLALVPGSPLAGIPISALYFAAALAPFWLVDATLLRPLMLPHFGWSFVAPIELASLVAYRCLLQTVAIRQALAADVTGILGDTVLQACLFYGFYLTATLVLFRWYTGANASAQ